MITELNVLNAFSINTTDFLKIENARLNDELIKLQNRLDDREQRNRKLCLLMNGVKENYRNNENTDDPVVAIINNELGSWPSQLQLITLREAHVLLNYS